MNLMMAVMIDGYSHTVGTDILRVAAPVPGTDSKSNGVFYHFIHNS